MDQNFHLVCVNPFGKYTKGQLITDSNEVEALQADRDHHFVRVAAPPLPVVEPPPVEEVKLATKPKLSGL